MNGIIPVYSLRVIMRNPKSSNMIILTEFCLVQSLAHIPTRANIPNGFQNWGFVRGAVQKLLHQSMATSDRLSQVLSAS